MWSDTSKKVPKIWARKNKNCKSYKSNTTTHDTPWMYIRLDPGVVILSTPGPVPYLPLLFQGVSLRSSYEIDILDTCTIGHISNKCTHTWHVYVHSCIHTCMYMNLLITLRSMCHLELRVGGMCKEHGATGIECQRERSRITSFLLSFLVWNLLDCVARTKITQISIIRRRILMITQGRITSMIPTILVI
jgi:hypothetical protein